VTVLLLGASGFLGGCLAARLPQTYATSAVRPRHGPAPRIDPVKWLDAPLDAADDRTLAPVLDQAGADVIVNAVGLTSSASDERLLRVVNSEFPHRLARCAESRGARVVHISTDGVFSGARGLYTESDAPDPIDAYGRSKLEGELPPPHMTIRTSFFGRNPRGAGLIEWLAAQRGRVDGFVDYRFTGIAAAILADLVAVALPLRLEGVYHVGGDPVSKFDLLSAAADRLAPGLIVNPATRVAIDRTLDSTKFFTAIGRRRPTLADSIEALSSWDALSRN
jgi:dTDP-4-dehydrorhamnose reductase